MKHIWQNLLLECVVCLSIDETNAQPPKTKSHPAIPNLVLRQVQKNNNSKPTVTDF